MPKKTTNLLAGAQVVAALKQAGEDVEGRQNVAEKSLAKGAIGVVHSPRTSKVMEDRAGKSTVSVRNQLQYFNGLGEHVVSTGFLQVLEDAKRKTTPRVGMTKKPCPHDKWADDRKPEDACECDGVNYFVRWADFHTYYKCYESCSALGEGRKED